MEKIKKYPKVIYHDLWVNSWREEIFVWLLSIITIPIFWYVNWIERKVKGWK